MATTSSVSLSFWDEGQKLWVGLESKRQGATEACFLRGKLKVHGKLFLPLLALKEPYFFPESNVGMENLAHVMWSQIILKYFQLLNGFGAESCQIMNKSMCLLAVDGIVLILLPTEIWAIHTETLPPALGILQSMGQCQDTQCKFIHLGWIYHCIINIIHPVS